MRMKQAAKQAAFFMPIRKEILTPYRTEWRYGNASKDLAYMFLTARSAVYFFCQNIYE